MNEQPTNESAASLLGAEGFGVENLPFGSFSINSGERQLGIRLGSSVYPAHQLARIAQVQASTLELLNAPNLDRLLTASHHVWATLRSQLTAFLTSAGSAGKLEGIGRPVAEVSLHLPFTVADYVDFYASEHHASNIGKIFRPNQAALLPNWHHLPIGYHGRSGTIVVSGTDIVRPKGLRPEKDADPSFGPSRQLDIETELGFVVGGSAPMGEVPLTEAEKHIFGVVVVNDWSARDIQAFEYVPLGPFLGKSFATSIGAWVIPLAALNDARVELPPRVKKPAAYLDTDGLGPSGLNIQFEVLVNDEVVSRPPFAQMYYSAAQMLTHMTVNGASLRPGDFFASGTISGPEKHQRGSFLELSWSGQEMLTLKDEAHMAFLEDGQEITLRATAPGPNGTIINLGEVRGSIIPSTGSGGN